MTQFAEFLATYPLYNETLLPFSRSANGQQVLNTFLATTKKLYPSSFAQKKKKKKASKTSEQTNAFFFIFFVSTAADMWMRWLAWRLVQGSTFRPSFC